MNAYVRVEIWLLPFVAPTIARIEWSASRHDHFNPAKTAPIIAGGIY
jgi:hypothetical protein